MTIVHIATKAISRKAGQSAVACAAYRSGDVLDDAKYGKTHDYGKKSGVMSSDIVLPFALKALGVSVDREMLWNLAEAAESRSDSRVAREWLINLPHELSESERYELAIKFAQKLVDDMDVIADVCIHRPVMKLPFDPDAKPSSKRLREGEENPDPRNFHAHIMVTTRAPLVGPNKTLAFDSNLKTPFEWSNKKRKAKGLPSSMQEIKRIREMWVDTANKVLAQHHLPLMDARSYQDQGLDQQPTIKMGVEATAMERRGITTEKGNTNRAIKARNKLVADNSIQQRTDHERRARKLRTGLAWATKQNSRLPILIGDAKQRVDSTKQDIEDTTSGIAWAAERCERIPNGIDTVNNRIKSTDDAIKWATGHSESLPKLIRDTEQRITDTEPNLDWTAKRCKNLPKRAAHSEQWVTANTKRAADSESIAQGIHQGITERAKPVPSPFDDSYRRAFLERKRQIDRDLAQADREANLRKYGDESISATAREAKQILAHRLITRSLEKNSLRKGYQDSSTDYPEKFDYRQMVALDDFAKSLSIDNDTSNIREKQNEVSDMLTFKVMTNNLSAIDILLDRKKERARYETITADFDEFIARADASRDKTNKEVQRGLGRTDTSRMTSEILTAVSYLEHIERYIDKEDTADDCKQLAEQRIKDTLARTCTQLKFSYQGLKDLDSTESVQKHVKALQNGLEGFTTKYTEKLTEGDLSNINDGLKVLDNKIDINKPNNTPSFGFR